MFHWPPSAMDAMSIEEIWDWHDRADKVWKAKNPPAKGGKK